MFFFMCGRKTICCRLWGELSSIWCWFRWCSDQHAPAGGVPFCSCRKEPKDTLKGETAGRASRLGGLPLKNPPLRGSQIWGLWIPFRRGADTDAGAPVSAAAECVGTEGWVGSILDAPGWRVVLAGWLSGADVRHIPWRPLYPSWPAAMPPYYNTAESRHKPSPWKGEGAPARTLGRMRVRMSGAFPGSPLIRQPAAATFPPVGGRYGNMGTAPQNRRFPSWPPNFSRTT